MRGFLICLLGLCIGCAGANLGPNEGWRKVSSAHFDVLTPLDSEDAQKTAVDLELFRAALLARWHREDLQTRHTTVVVYPDMATFNSHSADKFGGFARSEEGLLVEARPSFTESGLGLAKTIAHELSHQLDAAVLLRQPRWLNEGLASYLSTVTVEDGRAVFGRSSYEELTAARYLKPLSLEELWGWDEKDITAMSSEDLQRYYSTSWLWVSYLDNEHGDRFDTFLDALRKAQPPRAAFEAAFRGVSVAQMQHELTEYLTRIIPTQTIAVPAIDETVKETALAPAEVASLEARVWKDGLHSEPKEKREAFVAQQVAFALARDPNQADALVLQAELATGEDHRKLVQQLTEKAPSDPRGWMMLADDLAKSNQRDPLTHAVERALATGSNDPEVLVGAALYSQSPETQLSYAQRAVKLVPFSASFVGVLAQAEAASGQCALAKTDTERAVDLLPERSSAAARRRFADALQKAVDGCHDR